MWMEKRIVPVSVSFLVLIDNCAVLFVNVYAVFIVHGGLTLITLKNKQTTLPL